MNVSMTREELKEFAECLEWLAGSVDKGGLVSVQ
jgi:hypothetical protein